MTTVIDRPLQNTRINEEVCSAGLALDRASSVFMHFTIFGSLVPFFVTAILQELLNTPPGVLRSGAPELLRPYGWS